MAARVVLATKNRHKLDELHRILEGAGLDVELLGLRRVPRPARHPGDGVVLRGQRAAQGARDRADHRPARHRRRLGPVRRCAQRHARDLLGAMVGPARRRRGEPRAAARPARRTSPTDDAPRPSTAPPRSPCRTARSASSRARSRASSSASRGARTASATTRSSCPLGHDVTTAEMASEEKDAISHRGRALEALAPVMRELLES